jgi:hypothetical protein
METLNKHIKQHCSSKWERNIFLDIKSNENGGTGKMSFASLVPPKENQKSADISFDTKNIRKIKFSQIVKEETVYIPLLFWTKRLYFIMAHLIEAQHYKSESRGFDSR